MNVGLPGAGIGGLFYIVCALVMPVKEVFLTLRRPEHRFRYRLVLVPPGIAVGIVAGIVIVHRTINYVFGFDLSLSVPIGSAGVTYVSLLPVLIGSGLLLCMLSLVRIAAFFSAPGRSSREPRVSGSRQRSASASASSPRAAP